MSFTRRGLIYEAINRASSLIDRKIYNDIHKQHERRKEIVLDDESLTKDEKTEAIKLLEKDNDFRKVVFNDGTKRTCKDCNQECLATSYCECCVRNYLKANFSNWTSGNSDIDNLIQQCQSETLMPNVVQCGTSITDPLTIVIMWRFQINVTLAKINNLEF